MFVSDVILGKSKVHRLGIFANKRFPKGAIVYRTRLELIKVFKNEIMNWSSRKREKFLRYAFQGGKNFYYIPKKISSDFSFFINHSCDPNCAHIGARKIISIKVIRPGAELTIDYGTIMSPLGLEKPFRCRCGSKICRKIITRSDCLLPYIQAKYKEYFLPHILKFLSTERPKIRVPK